MNDHYTIKLDGGKYTVINHRNRLELLRHGEAWPAANEAMQHNNVVYAMAQRIEELENAIGQVLRGSVIHGACRADDGMVSFDEDSTVPFKDWEARLRNVLEQKP